jgi:hypothetical protein
VEGLGVTISRPAAEQAVGRSTTRQEPLGLVKTAHPGRV